ncbi:MAG: Hpt domain-containing protein [Deltaproteobacteria bacterium]
MNAEIYKTEALELLDELEAALLELEEQPANRTLVDRVFRALHTIKGSGKMFGFDEIAAFTHDIETTYDSVREGVLVVSPELVSLTLAARDIIRAMVNGEPVDDEARADFVRQFQAMQVRPEERPTEIRAEAGQNRQPGKKEPAIYRIRFKPAVEIFRSGTNLTPLFRELAEIGESTVICHTETVPPMADLQPESCYLSWDIVLTTDRGEEAIRDIFIFVEEDCNLEITAIVGGNGDDDQEKHRLLGQILLDRGDISQITLNEILASKPLFGQTLVKAKAVDQSNVDAALAEQRHMSKLRQAREHMVVGSIRVAADKLDTLVDLVGELVIVQARLSQYVSGGDDPTAVAIAEDVERLTAELRDNTMGLRMVPIGTTFSKFKRLVRDLSRELGKKAELIMEGGKRNWTRRLSNGSMIHWSILSATVSITA